MEEEYKGLKSDMLFDTVVFPHKKPKRRSQFWITTGVIVLFFFWHFLYKAAYTDIIVHYVFLGLLWFNKYCVHAKLLIF